MAHDVQKILELCEEKSSKPFGSKVPQLSLEINHSCSGCRCVHIIFSLHGPQFSKCLMVDKSGVT